MEIQSCWKGKRFAAVLLLAILAGPARHTSAQAGNELRKQFQQQFAAAALERTQHVVRYDPAYVQLPYPGGDVPGDTGVCTDEVIRAYRAVGIDLQKEVHEDMVANFSAYPSKWGRRNPDPNIDHRRVPNLMVFFSRKGASLPITDRAEDYAPGDLVTWDLHPGKQKARFPGTPDLGGGLTHIGMVVDRKTLFTRRYMIVHNIGAGPKMEDVLFDWKITGHYRYFGPAGRATRAQTSKISFILNPLRGGRSPLM